MRDELNEPLGVRPTPAPLSARLRPLAVWGGRFALALLAVGAGALYWRGVAPPKGEVAVIPFEVIQKPPPTPTVAAASAAPTVARCFRRRPTAASRRA